MLNLPLAQYLHACSDFIEYMPAWHAVQFVAPVLVPVPVIDPAEHGWHALLPAEMANLPMAHGVQTRRPEMLAIVFLAHAAHDDAPVTELAVPGAQAMHSVAP